MPQPVMPAQPHGPSPNTMRDTNRFSTRTLVSCALLCAIGVLLSLVELPLLPGVPWLKYDASAMPAIVSGFAYGPAAGACVGMVGAVIHGLLFADASGAVMNILVVVAIVVPASAIFQRHPSFASQILGLVVGCLAMVAAAILGNLVITPAWLGVPLDAVIAMILPILLPFNVLKAALNAVLSVIVFKAVSRMMDLENGSQKASRTSRASRASSESASDDASDGKERS